MRRPYSAGSLWTAAGRALGGVLLSALAFPSSAAEPAAQLTLAEPVMLTVDPASNTASAQFELQNRSNQETPIALRATDFINRATRRRLGAKVTFSEPPAAAVPLFTRGAPLKPGEVLSLKVEATQLWEAGESEAELVNRGVVIGKLVAVKDRVPLAVKLEFATPNRPEIPWERDKKSLLPLRNEDAMTYPVRWKLLVGRHELSGEKSLAPSSVSYVEVPGTDVLFQGVSYGWLKDTTLEARLSVAFHPGPAGENAVIVKELPFQLTLRPVPAAVQSSVRYVVIFIALVLGGLASLLLNYALPNRERRLRLKERLDAIGKSIADLSFLLDSRLRVSAGVERKRLRHLLESNWAVSPDFADVVNQVEATITTLEKRVRLLRQMDSSLDRFAALRAAGLPPSLVEGIESAYDRVRELLMRSEPAAADLTAAENLIVETTARLEKSEQVTEAQVKELERQFSELQAFFQPRADRWKVVLERLPGPFEALASGSISAGMSPGEYLRLDTVAYKLRLIRQLLQLYEGAADPDYRKRLENALEALLAALVAQNWENLRWARLLVREARENIFGADLRKELESPETQLQIIADRNDVRSNDPVEFGSSFRRRYLNDSAAREEYTCTWAFSHSSSPHRQAGRMRTLLPTLWGRLRGQPAAPPAPDGRVPAQYRETGWAVAHYFPSVGKQRVEVCFEDRDGRPVLARGAGEHASLVKEIQVRPSRAYRFGERSWLEGIRLAIAVVTAEVVLVAGAQEQLAKLEFGPGLVAVFLLGFGADTLKNLLTRR